MPARSSTFLDREIPGRAVESVILADRIVILDQQARFHVFDSAGRHLWNDDLSSGDTVFPGRSASLEPALDFAGAAWVHDRNRSRSLLIDFRGDPQAARTPIETISFPDQPVVFDFRWVGEGRIVGSGLFEDTRYAFFDARGMRVGGAGDIPGSAADDGAPAHVRQHAHMGPITSAPRRNRFAAATRHADEIAFYDRDGRLLRRVRGSTGFEPTYSVHRTKGVAYMVSGDDLRFGYVGLASNDSIVFALYSGRERRHPEGSANYGRYVQLFDWDGRLLGTFALGFSASGIVAAPRGRTLLAMQRQPSSTTVRLHLDPVSQ